MGFRTFVRWSRPAGLRPGTTSNHLPGVGALRSRIFIRDDDAGVEDALSRRRVVERRDHGLHRQRPGEFQARPTSAISLPGTGETPAAPVFRRRQEVPHLARPHIATEFKAMVIDYIDQRLRRGGEGAGDRGRSKRAPQHAMVLTWPSSPLFQHQEISRVTERCGRDPRAVASRMRSCGIARRPARKK